MQTFRRLLAVGGVILALCAGAGKVRAQGGGGFPGGGGGGGFPGPPGGGGGFDMSQMMKMVVDNMQEPLEVTDDNEWKVISAQVQKVMELRMQASSGGGMGMMGMMGRRGGMGGGGPGGGGMQALFGPNPEGEALQRAIDAKASNAELKAAVDKMVEARKKKQAALEKAQADLQKLLSVRQEAIAYSMGLL